MASRQRVFVVVAPGLERLAAAELRELGTVGRPRIFHGGIEVELSTRQLYAIHRHARLPTRVLVRVARGRATRFGDLEALVRSVNWDDYLREATPIRVRAAAHRSSLYHTEAIAERVVGAIGHRSEGTGQMISVRVAHDTATISVDASGDALHRRGWRDGSHAAPLRATLASAMLRAARYDGGEPLVDPMCGSGTIVIEAARLVLALPNDRPFAFENWPSFEAGTWASVCAPLEGRSPEPIVAADRDVGAVDVASANAARAGVGASIRFERAALDAQLWPAERGLVVCNPPYGHRLGDSRGLRNLYAALGNRVVASGHRLCLLTADDSLARATGLPLEERFATTNGGISVRCWVSTPAGTV